MGLFLPLRGSDSLHGEISLQANTKRVRDSGGNDLDDDWEVQYFGDIGVKLYAGGDRLGNLPEYLAVTSPPRIRTAPCALYR